MSGIRVGGITLDVDEHGDRTAPALLLIMGLGMPGIAWPDALVERFVAVGLRVIRFDNRDSGHSTKLAASRLPNLRFAIARALLGLPVRGPYTLDDMAEDAAGLLTALGIERAHVVGASLGGMIGQVLAARHAQRVLSLTSIMSASGNRSPRVSLGRRQALRAILERPRSGAEVQAIADHYVRVLGVIGSPGYPAEPAAQRRFVEGIARRGYHPAGTARQLLAILASGDRRTLLARIAAPTLVIHGADDPLLPVAAGIDTARHIPGARLEIIPGMGHDLPDALLPRLATLIVAHVHAAASRDA